MEQMQKEEVIKLIALYKQNECLWNINSKLFRRTDIKNNAIRKIATEMGMDEEVIKKKIKNIRTSYTAERKKILNSKKSGAGIDEVKESNLFYYSDMEFLNPCISFRKGQNNYVSMGTIICSSSYFFTFIYVFLKGCRK